MATILGAELQVNRLISADPTNGVLAALNTGGAAVNLMSWSPLTGDISYTAPAGTGTNTRRHIFDGPIVGQAAVNNLGSSVIQHTWNASYKAVELGPNAALFYRTVTDEIYLYSGLFNDGADRYSWATAGGAVYSMSGGIHSWHTAPSGALGALATVTERMRLSNVGILLLGTTVTTSASAGEIVLGYQKALRGLGASLGSSFGMLRATGWGYATDTYRVTQVGEIGGTVALGYDPSVNSSGSFAGDGKEILVQNPVRFMQPNGTTAFYSMFGCISGVMHIGSPASVVGAAVGDLVLANLRSVRAANVGGTGTMPLISLDAQNFVQLATVTMLNPAKISYDTVGQFFAGNASSNGVIGIDSTNNRFVYYSGGAKYYLAGTAF